MHREWCKQNLEAWKAAQTAIRDIPDHPNAAAAHGSNDTPHAELARPELGASVERDLPPVPSSTSSTPTPPSVPVEPFSSVPIEQPSDYATMGSGGPRTVPAAGEGGAVLSPPLSAATSPTRTSIASDRKLGSSPPQAAVPASFPPPAAAAEDKAGNAKVDDESGAKTKESETLSAAGPLGPL